MCHKFACGLLFCVIPWGFVLYIDNLGYSFIAHSSRAYVSLEVRGYQVEELFLEITQNVFFFFKRIYLLIY